VGDGWPAGAADRVGSLLPGPARPAGRVAPRHPVHGTPGLQCASLRNADDAVYPQPRAEGHRTGHVDDSARLLHDEAERGEPDAAADVGALLAHPSVRPAGPGAGLRADRERARTRSCRDYRVQRGLAATELRSTG